MMMILALVLVGTTRMLEVGGGKDSRDSRGSSKGRAGALLAAEAVTEAGKAAEDAVEDEAEAEATGRVGGALRVEEEVAVRVHVA